MAAYAALVSFMNNIIQIKEHPRVSTMFDQKQMDSLLEKVDSLLVSVESFNNSYEAEDLERQIASAAHFAEDVIESHIVDHILIIQSTNLNLRARYDIKQQMLNMIRSFSLDYYDVINFKQDLLDLIQSPSLDIDAVSNIKLKMLNIIQSPSLDTDAVSNIQQEMLNMIQSLSLDTDAEDLDIQLEMLDVREIIQDMDSIWEKVMKAEEERGFKVDLPIESSTRADTSRPPPPAGRSSMVGFDGYSAQLLLKLTGDQPNLQVFPIVGMGGIGKTTLTRNAYDSVPVAKHFRYRAWVVMSQTFIMRNILLEILSCLGQSKDEMDKKTEFELRQLLHQTLFNRRYLIVIDDMWSIDAWDKIKFYFPNNCNGSRILVTTRISDVANHFGSIGFELSVLNKVHSWKLFCEKTFPHEDCPAELEECGKEIVRKCRGLPLAIVVIGGLLGSISRTIEQWENVKKDITSILNAANDNQCLKLLSMSYSHLPARLKPCFLYMGIFPEDDVIRVSKLIKLWVAEGFVKPNKDQSLEEIAEGYVKNLVDRNLISVDSLRWSGKVKRIRIHDLLRDLCIRVAQKEKFLCFTRELNTPQDMDRQRRRVISPGSTCEEENCTTGESKLITRSIIFNQGERPMHFKSKLLRVLVGVSVESRNIIFQQVNLRVIAHDSEILKIHYYHLPSSISLIWNLQTLIIAGLYEVYAPSEIWKMPQFRHLMGFNIIFPKPSPGDGIVLHNLQTLGAVADFEFSEEACKKIPNIKKLRVHHNGESENGANFVFLNKLESLHYLFSGKTSEDDLLPLFFKFPNSLKKLTLECPPLQWEVLRVISSLPYLEALIMHDSISRDNWDLAELQFLRLRFLRIVISDLECWNANDTHFPVLENLVLEEMPCLSEIPLEIGNIQTLECISLHNCNVSGSISAVKIQEEQENFGNKGLQVKIHFFRDQNTKSFMESVELEGLTGVNFQINEG